LQSCIEVDQNYMFYESECLYFILETGPIQRCS